MKKILISLFMSLPLITYAGSHALYEFTSASYIIENNRHEVRPIASITKLFTAITVLIAVGAQVLKLGADNSHDVERIAFPC